LFNLRGLVDFGLLAVPVLPSAPFGALVDVLLGALVCFSLRALLDLGDLVDLLLGALVCFSLRALLDLVTWLDFALFETCGDEVSGSFLAFT
jgi:hypothetical protein